MAEGSYAGLDRAVAAEHGSRVAARQAANGPWPEYRGEINTSRAPVVDPGAPKEVRGFVPLAVETGGRTKVRAVIANARLDDPRVIARLGKLAEVYGGFTAQEVVGGWVDEAGVYTVEPGLSIEVSFEADRPAVRARDLLAQIGQDIGERWVHVEAGHFVAHHVKVNE